MPPHKTPRPIPPEEQSTKSMVRDAAADAAAEAAAGALEKLTPLLGRQSIKNQDSYGKDKRDVIAWVSAAAGSALLAWGIWITSEVYGVRAANSLASEQIRSNESQSRERDKTLSETAAERAAQIQLQLAQIQAQLAEIQRELRKGNGHQ